MKITFGAKLITSPESFIKKTDTPEQQEHIKKVFRQLDSFLSLKKVDELSANDTVELVRSNGKKKFHYTINYRTPSNEEIIPIHMHCGNTPDNFHFYDNFYQLTYPQ